MTQSDFAVRTDPPWKTAERRCRRKAQRAGLRMERRMWPSYHSSGGKAGAYQLVDPATDEVVAGDVTRGEGMDLDAVEAFLDAQPRPRGVW